MRFSCTICSDLFDGNTITIATPCGHVFHEACINQWIAVSKTCPECRKPVTKKNIFKLFFCFSTTEKLSSDSLENEVDALKAKLRGKDCEINNVKKQVDDIREFFKATETKCEKLKQRNHKYQSEITALRLENQLLAELRGKLQCAEKASEVMNTKIQHYVHLETVISGTQKDVEDMLQSCLDAPEAAKQMATYVSLLKKELHNVTVAKSGLRIEIGCLRKDNSLNNLKLKHASEEIKHLKEQLQSLEKENASLLMKQNRSENLASSSTSKATICFESPTPERLKRPEPSSDIIETTPVSDRIMKAPIKKFKVQNLLYEKSNTQVLKTTCRDIPNPNVKVLSALQLKPQMQEQDSVIRDGYNGFGGHSKFISRSSSFYKNSFHRPTKKK